MGVLYGSCISFFLGGRGGGGWSPIIWEFKSDRVTRGPASSRHRNVDMAIPEFLAHILPCRSNKARKKPASLYLLLVVQMQFRNFI